MVLMFYIVVLMQSLRPSIGLPAMITAKLLILIGNLSFSSPVVSSLALAVGIKVPASQTSARGALMVVDCF